MLLYLEKIVLPPAQQKNAFHRMRQYKLFQKHTMLFSIVIFSQDPSCDEQASIPTKMIPLIMNIGLLPLISEKGASTIGARPNPTQKIVIAKLYTTKLIPHSAVSSADAGLASPAE